MWLLIYSWSTQNILLWRKNPNIFLKPGLCGSIFQIIDYKNDYIDCHSPSYYVIASSINRDKQRLFTDIVCACPLCLWKCCSWIFWFSHFGWLLKWSTCRTCRIVYYFVPSQFNCLCISTHSVGEIEYLTGFMQKNLLCQTLWILLGFAQICNIFIQI